MLDRIEETAAFLKSRLGEVPKLAMITGTGLDAVTNRVDVQWRVPFHEIPNFPVSTVQGHRGTLIAGRWGQQGLIALEGRFHLYEGYSPKEIAFPIRVFARLGVRFLFMSSAAGGLDPRFQSGDLMLVTDHINLTGTNPLMGPNLESFGPRFPDMTEVYDPGLVALARTQALKIGILLREGVYAGITGPSLETPSETRLLKMIGAHAVGMSTVTEAIAAAHCGMKTACITAITNVNLPDCMKKTAIEDVIATASSCGPSLALLWENILHELDIDSDDN
jgi:purine-nucleoside phosphorylase